MTLAVILFILFFLCLSGGSFYKFLGYIKELESEIEDDKEEKQ